MNFDLQFQSDVFQTSASNCTRPFRCLSLNVLIVTDRNDVSCIFPILPVNVPRSFAIRPFEINPQRLIFATKETFFTYIKQNYWFTANKKYF